MFAVYQHDVTGSPLSELLDADASRFTSTLAEAVVERAEALDVIIDRHAHGWSVDRLAPLDRAILRVAILEITEPQACGEATPIPAEGAIVEAVETAKQFCSTDAPGFINGILGGVIEEVSNR